MWSTRHNEATGNLKNVHLNMKVTRATSGNCDVPYIRNVNKNFECNVHSRSG